VAEQQYRIARRGAGAADTATRLRIAEGLGDVLMLRGRYEEAARELEAALELADQPDFSQAQIVGKLGELAFKRGDVRTGSERIERALRLLGRRVPRSNLVFFVLVLWEVLVQILHTLMPRLFLARRSLAGAETELIALRLYSRLAHLYWFHRGTVPALWAHLRGLNRAERYPPTPELAQAYSEHAPGMSLLARFDRGIAYAEKSLVIRKELGDLWGQGQSLHFYGVVLYAAARFKDCIDKCREAVRLLERTGDYWEVNIARYQVAASLYRLGDLREAVAESQRMYQSGLELGDAQASGISLDVWARASLGGVPVEVIATELKRPGGDVQRTAQILVAEGVRWLYAGQPAEATAVLKRARSLVKKAGVQNAWVAPVFPWLVTALRQSAEAAGLADVTPGHRRDLLRRAWKAARQALRVARSFRNELPHALREAALLCAAQGRSRRARRYFDESLAAAQRQGARYEHAQTQLARGRVGQELGWAGADEDVAQARLQISDFRLQMEKNRPGSALPNLQSVIPRETLALADRFDTVLDTGRRIASALSRDATFIAIREAALKLLRGERCLILEVNGPPGHGHGNEVIRTVSGEIEAEFSRTMVLKTLATGRALAFVEGVADTTSESVLLSGVRSALCAPFYVRGRAVGCFYVTHRQVAGLFGEEEERLADFIATLAGAALENAEGFAELRRLNEALELRITEGKRAEKQIQEQAALLELAQDAISVHGLDDRILFWNRSAERLYGWTAAEALGKKAGELLFRGGPGTSGASPTFEAAARAVREQGEWAGELRQVTRAGKEIVVESRWSLVRDEAGHPKARLVVSTDVTEKKRLEIQFLRAQRLESLGTLAGGIAHDINNVLTPILMGVGLLGMDLPRSERSAVLADLEASAQRGADMVQQILSFARGVDGQRVLLRLSHVITELERMVTRTFPKSIAVTVEVPPDLWPVAGDATQLYQMLMNLCVNSRDAMPDGGTLTITASNTEEGDPGAGWRVAGTDLVNSVSSPSPGSRHPYVRLSVLDTGTGIPPDLLDKIFDPFFTTKEHGKGTGLGLSTVLGIVKGHGGFVHVTSTVGTGTRVDAYLPAAGMPRPSEAGKKTEKELSGPLRGRQELILVVDDELFIREITRKNLEAHGYRVLTARDGGEAVALYSRHGSEISAVLTDMMMPGMGGASTIRALRALNPAVRIIVVSGLSVATECAEADVQGFLAKPYKVERLLQTLGEVLRA
jgi:PAS domain S-box-containing protein